MNTLSFKKLFLPVLAAAAMLQTVQASEWNQKTMFTFNTPVEIPGQVLPAGTYVFKLADSQSSRHIVQVFSQDEKSIFATILAIPDYRLQASEKTIIRFEERPGDAPQAIKGWFYPGRTYGHEFVYPKNEAVALAKANHTPVPAMPDEVAEIMIQHHLLLTKPEIHAFMIAPLKVEEPSGEEVEVAEEFPIPAAAETSLPEELPSTASPLPLIGLIGILSLAAAGAVGFSAKRATK